MAHKLASEPVKHAKSLIESGKVDTSSSWSFSPEDGDALLGDPPNWGNYGKWFLGRVEGKEGETKDSFAYPIGKGGKVYRRGLIAAEGRASQNEDAAIVAAAKSLIAAIDEKSKAESRLAIGVPARSQQKVGGTPPEWIRIFPDGDYECEDGTYLCDAESRKLCIEYFAERGNDAVIDYEHQTLTGEQAPASGWITELEDRGAEGLWAHVEWTAKAKEFISSGEYRYYSPVFDFHKETKRVVRLHHVALTNWPGSNNMTALTKQVAATVRAGLSNRVMKGEKAMDELMQRLQYFLSLPITATHNDARTALQKIMEAIPADDTMLIVAEKAGDAKTLSAALGITKPAEPAPAATTVAAKALLEELDLQENATLAQAHARVGELKTRTAKEDVEKLQNDLKAAKARISELEAKTDAEKVTQLITENRAKISPAREPWIRQVAKKYGLEHAVEVVKQLKDDLPAPPPAGPEHEPELVVPTTTKDGRPVNQQAAERLAKVKKIAAEKNLGIEEANEELRRQERAAAARQQ